MHLEGHATRTDPSFEALIGGPQATTTSGATLPTIVLVHGAWHGPWCWDRLRPELHALGWPTTAPSLPSAASAASQPTPGLRDDVEALTSHIDSIAGPVVLLGHSYGGAPVTEAAALRRDQVSHLLYVAAYMPDVADSLYSMHGLSTPEDVTGLVPVPPDPIAMFYADVEPNLAADAAHRLTPQTVRSWTEQTQHAGWATTPSTYLMCEHDQALPPSMQAMFAARADHLVRLDSSHSPFLSQPQRLAAHVNTALTGRLQRKTAHQ